MHGYDFPNTTFGVHNDISTESAFQRLRANLLSQYGDDIFPTLAVACDENVRLHVRPAPVSLQVQHRFLNALESSGDASLIATYHGTDENNLESIYRRGLVVPGFSNSIYRSELIGRANSDAEPPIEIANGNVHGPGIYTANITSPRLSLGFCQGSSHPKLLICGVIDDTKLLPAAKEAGCFECFRESSAVRYVGDAVIVSCADRVVPLFTVTIAHDLPCTTTRLRWLDMQALMWWSGQQRHPIPVNEFEDRLDLRLLNSRSRRASAPASKFRNRRRSVGHGMTERAKRQQQKVEWREARKLLQLERQAHRNVRRHLMYHACGASHHLAEFMGPHSCGMRCFKQAGTAE